MKKEDIKTQAAVFETVRKWLQEEYKKAKGERPKNNALVFELENRIKSFKRETDNFNKLKKQLGVD